MAYTPDIPQSTDDPTQSQALILANFQEIATAFNLNHGDFNDPSNQGKHEFLQMPEQSSAPSTAASEGALYTKDSGTQPELFWRDESNGTEWQITNQATQTSNGSMLFPGGLLMQWGSSTTVGASVTVTFPVAFSSAVYSIQATYNQAGTSAISVSSVTTSDFVVATAVGNSPFYWMAIGV